MSALDTVADASDASSIDRRRMLGALSAISLFTVPSSAGAAVGAIEQGIDPMNMHTAFSFSAFDRAANTAWVDALARMESARVALDKVVPVLETAETAYYACKAQWSGIGRCHPGETVATFNARVEAGVAEVGRLHQVVEQVYDQQAAACAILDEALDSLIAMPAPDLAAVIQKIEMAWAYDRDIDALAPALVDLRRMGGH